MDQKHTGAYSEHKAISWLLKQGYMVFKNVSPHGPIDLIAVKSNDNIHIDVTTGQIYNKKDGTISYSFLTSKIKDSIKVIVCFPETDEIGWAEDFIK